MRFRGYSRLSGIDRWPGSATVKRSMAALVVGNGAYRGCGPLKNPVNDAEDIATKLRSYGFQVLVATDASRVEMDRQLRRFSDLLATNDVGLFFLAECAALCTRQNIDNDDQTNYDVDVEFSDSDECVCSEESSPSSPDPLHCMKRVDPFMGHPFSEYYV